MEINEIKISDIDVRVILTKDLTDDDLDGIRQLFEHSYHQANYSYLEKSFAKLRWLLNTNASHTQLDITKLQCL